MRQDSANSLSTTCLTLNVLKVKQSKFMLGSSKITHHLVPTDPRASNSENRGKWLCSRIGEYMALKRTEMSWKTYLGVVVRRQLGNLHCSLQQLPAWARTINTRSCGYFKPPKYLLMPVKREPCCKYAHTSSLILQSKWHWLEWLV